MNIPALSISGLASEAIHGGGDDAVAGGDDSDVAFKGRDGAFAPALFSIKRALRIAP